MTYKITANPRNKSFSPSLNKTGSSYLLKDHSLYYNPNRIQYLYNSLLNSDDRYFLSDHFSMPHSTIPQNNFSTQFNRI